jgi:hypothetical protein
LKQRQQAGKLQRSRQGLGAGLLQPPPLLLLLLLAAIGK